LQKILTKNIVARIILPSYTEKFYSP